ncbi:hypothetical protein H0X06_00600 [Candidatus Dependentiae bacterium]|nr:hypothetical protein [Candidatus Dependentiae bacterium]
MKWLMSNARKELLVTIFTGNYYSIPPNKTIQELKDCSVKYNGCFYTFY